MDYNAVILFSLITVILAARESSALQCYVCNGCNDPFDPSQAREITCFGSCGKTKRGDSGYVERTCNKVNVQKPKCEAFDSASSDYIEACACNANLCNSASWTQHSFVLQIVCVLAFLVLLKYCS